MGVEEGEKWPLWKLVLMALPQVGVQVLWAFIGPYSAPYMRHLGLPDSLATLNNIAGPITGFFTGPLVGATSDSLTSRFGRRRPVILAGLVSVCIAGALFSGSEHFMPEGKAVYFAAPMYWVLDVTINVLQTPHRALVSDLATEDQQVPMQVAFVVLMSVGNFMAFSVMTIYKSPVDHMFTLMCGICAFNCLCVGIQFLVAREEPLKKDPDGPKQSACAPVMDVVGAVAGSPRLLYHLAAVQCLVWIGITAWTLYAGQWFGNAVYGGDEKEPDGSPSKIAYENGIRAFSVGGHGKAVLQLISALLIIAILLKTNIRPRLVYAPCIFIGLVVSILAAFFVGHNGTFAIVVMIFSVLPETGSFAIPFGLVATLNKRAEQEGKHVSTALQMALLNCCVTIGQQICTMSLAGIEASMELEAALPCVFIVAGVAQALGGVGTLFLDDRPDDYDESATLSESDSSD
ncbi:unnamed protein product [Effrenium voratum]|nr:unnamed protein product [Effrenium voratum]|eukprot:CAMPEP_0181406058 /NCGR_PEP_ID=MMETSP1110-20121109/5077_1 /TAXON_ID=174948 /ORGANISM="Symbiodinium sp., Strain CCMP421" /LENGTH=459 /DNA_ID=CAMNT_0023528461 /DNA_START=68 /DNA_END=1447 /DNA_ORIENTATION=-